MCVCLCECMRDEDDLRACVRGGVHGGDEWVRERGRRRVAVHEL